MSKRQEGYVYIPDNVSEKMMSIKLSGGEFRILYFLLRRTGMDVGSFDAIRCSEFMMGTNLPKGTVQSGLSSLAKKRVILAKKISIDNYMAYAVNVNAEEWSDQ